VPLRLSVNNLQLKEPKSCKMLKGHDEWIAGKRRSSGFD
jgi:hypothetical protein